MTIYPSQRLRVPDVPAPDGQVRPDSPERASGSNSDHLATDGRKRRSQTSQRRIVSAMIELVGEGHVTPSAELVAERAKVGLRSVFRHFKDMDSLYREMAASIETAMAGAISTPFQARDWQGQILEMVERRSATFERLAPYLRAGQVHRHRSRVLRAGHDQFVILLRQLLQERVPPATLAEETMAALELLLSFETWSRLRHEQSLDPLAAKRVLSHTIGRLLGQHPPR